MLYVYISGQKGIGFKSVFRVSDCPEVHSNGYHIRFDAKSGPIGYILPEWIGDKCPEEQTGEDVENGIGDMENEDNDDGLRSAEDEFSRCYRCFSPSDGRIIRELSRQKKNDENNFLLKLIVDFELQVLNCP